MTGKYEARAEGEGRIYQSAGDQHIIEYHQHGPSDLSSPAVPDSVQRPAVGRPPVVLRDRDELMDRLRLAAADDEGNQVLVLHGLGGCGKTAVAYALFEYATEACGRLGLWVNSSDSATLRAGMLAVAADRGAGAGELTAARSGLRAASDMVWEYLDRSPERWLLVLDNADDPTILQEGNWLRTSPQGITLVTSRQAAARWWPGAQLLRMDVLPREDAARVLCDLAPESGTEEEAAQIADRLGRLPLALTLAGGFLSHQVIAPWTMSEYGRNLSGDHGLDPVELIDQGAAGGGFDARHLVSRTWQLSLDALTAQGVPESEPLLRLLSCWAGDPLPLSLLAGADFGEQLPPHRVEIALRGLLDQSLTTLSAGPPRSLRTHGVLLDSVAHGTPDDQRDLLAATAARLMAAALPEAPERGEPDPALSMFAPHALSLLRRTTDWAATTLPTVEAAINCLWRLVVALHRTGDYSSAYTVAQQGLELGRRRLDADHPSLLRLHLRLARTEFRIGQFVNSEERYRRLLHDCERVLGSDAPETLETCGGLAVALQQLDRLSEAVPLLRTAVERGTEVLGPLDPLTLLGRATMLEVLSGEQLEAEVTAAPQLIEDAKRELGEEHMVCLAAELNFARALYISGRAAEALPRASWAYDAHKRRFGPEFPVTLACRDLLSGIHFALGQEQEGIAHALGVHEGRTRALGFDHPWTLRMRELLAQYGVSPQG